MKQKFFIKLSGKQPVKAATVISFCPHYQFLALLDTATKKVDVSLKGGEGDPFLRAAWDTMPSTLSSFTPPASCKSYEVIKATYP